jgi:hypothetical protein
MDRTNDILNGIKTYIIDKKESDTKQQATSEEQRVLFPEIEYEDDRLSLISEDDKEGDEKDIETDTSEEEEESDEYKEEFYEMSLGSIKSIMVHAQNIINALDNPSVKENLTESWLQGKIAITEDYMITIHNFVMFGPSETDTEGSDASKKPGLWDNIRKKKEKEGKNYRPAKPGDKDRPDLEQWKKLTK